MKLPVQPPHIGILCDYGFTLLPHGGIGVFVYNLIDGLLTLTPCPKITLLTHPGDQEGLKEWSERWQSRVRILPTFEESKAVGSRLGQLLKKGRDSSIHLEIALRTSWDHLARHFKRQGQPYRVISEVGSWIGEMARFLSLLFLVSLLTLPLRLAYRVYHKLVLMAHPLKSRMAEAGCDVWLVPFAGIKTPIHAPQVLVIFDLVFRHVPEIYSATKREFFERVFAARAREATLIYCGSHFVKSHDLIPCYPFAADRIRVFPLAPPMDFQGGTGTADLSALRSKYGIGTPFLFYPAALRAHKNHAMLVRALKLLREKHGLATLDLVFTGEGQHKDLLDLVQIEGLDCNVRFLGLLSRKEIQALYRHAVLVPLPSLHEGYGLPLLEALENECPVACADIPAFRELLEGHMETVQFFDPHDPKSIAEAISLTIARRDEFRDRQAKAYRKIASRDWHAVAQDFLQLFVEACRLTAGDQPTSSASSTTPVEIGARSPLNHGSCFPGSVLA